MLLSSGTSLGPYEIVRPLGSGGPMDGRVPGNHTEWSSRARLMIIICALCVAEVPLRSFLLTIYIYMVL